ncbi:hypothetical protein Tco_1191578 [Tanacetum coccineum]
MFICGGLVIEFGEWYFIINGSGRYVVSTGKDNFIVSAGRPYMVPASRTIAIKMEYWITNNDMNIWKVIQNGNSLKRTGRDRDGRVIILPPMTADEHIAVQRESKARTTLLQSIPDDHWIAQRVALTLKTKGGLELLSFDDLYYKLKTLEIDIKGYSTHSSSQSPSHSAFVSTTSTSKKISYAEILSFSPSTTYSAPSSSKARSHSSGNVLQDVLHSLVAESEPEQQVAYEDFEQIDKLDLEEMDIKWQMAMLSVRVNKFEKKAGRKIEFDKKEAARNDEGFAPKEYGMVAGCGAACEEGAAKVYSLITGNGTDAAAGEFALMGMTSEVQAYKNSLKTLEKQKRVYQQNQLGYEEKIRVLSIELENTTNLLKHSERINVEAEIAKKDLQTKLDNHLVQIEKWRTSTKNLFRLIDSSMSVRTKVGLGFNNYISENELGWDDSAFSVFTTNSEEVEGRPIFNSDKSSEVNINDFASSDSSVKSSEPKSNDSTSYASTSSELPSFSCTNKDVKTSRIPCNKNGYFNKKASHFRKNNSFASKSCFVCGSYLHLTKDCNYYETQYANDFDGIGYPQREPIWDNATRVTQSNQFIPQAVLLRFGKVSIPAARPNQVPAGRPKPVSTGRPKPISIGKQNRPPSVHAGRGNSSSVTSGWWDGWATAVKPSAGCSWKSHRNKVYRVNLHTDAEDEGIIDSGYSRCMTGKKERLDDFHIFACTW